MSNDPIYTAAEMHEEQEKHRDFVIEAGKSWEEDMAKADEKMAALEEKLASCEAMRDRLLDAAKDSQRFLKTSVCPHCENRGWYTAPSKLQPNTACQYQCEWCFGREDLKAHQEKLIAEAEAQRASGGGQK